MKRIFQIAILALIGFVSCSEEQEELLVVDETANIDVITNEEAIGALDKEKYKTTIVSDVNVINDLKKSFGTFSKGRSTSDEYNWSEVSEITSEDSEVVSYSVPSINDSNSFLGLYENGEGFAGVKLIVENESEDVGVMNYYDANDNLIISIIADNTTQQVSYEIPTDKSTFDNCGDDTATCVTSLYEDQGWASVALIVLSFAGPEIPLAAIASCALAHCIVH
ncbi:hypothetical protein [Dokdonia sp.]|uniref:hypothetical protein n=1 Tax=Dokdonia sp. TaxID=2024995 RepID=UPI003267D4BE